MQPNDELAVQFLTDIVGIPSVSGEERAVAEHIVAVMDALGFDAEIDAAGNAVGRVGQGRPVLLLLGHIDTVPGVVPVRREGRLLYGRGAVDAKGPFAAFVLAAARSALVQPGRGPLAREEFAGQRPAPQGQVRGGQIVVVGAVEEEAATSKGAYHVVETYPPADHVIIGEPSGWSRITLGYKGRLLLDYALERPMAHTAGQERAAAEDAVEFWLRVRDDAAAYNADKEGAFATLDPSLRRMHADNDGLTERAELGIGLRLPVGFDVEALIDRVQREWRGDATVETRGHELPYRADKRTPLISAFLSAIRAEGERAAFVLKTGTSDMNVIGPRWNVPIVAYGPGDSSLDHTPDEHIDLDEYLAAIRVLERVIARLGGSG